MRALFFSAIILFAKEGKRKLKVLIAYASKTGTAEKAAKLLGEHFADVTLRDLTVGRPNPKDYDAVIVGGSIRMGTLHKAARIWLIENWDVIKAKKFGCFICNGFIDQAPQLIEQNFSQELINLAVCVDSFGGEMDLEKLRGLDRFVAKNVMKSMSSKGSMDFVPCILTDRIQLFAEKFKEK